MDIDGDNALEGTASSGFEVKSAQVFQGPLMEVMMASSKTKMVVIAQGLGILGANPYLAVDLAALSTLGSLEVVTGGAIDLGGLCRPNVCPGYATE